MKASEIRATFLKFFESKGHTVVPTSPVVPGDVLLGQIAGLPDLSIRITDRA